MTGRPLLRIEKLRVSFADPEDPRKKIEAVKGIDLSLAANSFTSVVGESGSGKTVTALSVTRLVRAQDISGRIFWDEGSGERDLLAAGEKELLALRGRQIAYVFQDPASSLNPVLRVGPQVAEAYRTHFPSTDAQAKARVLEMFAAVKLADAERVYRSYPHELSGGMRQRTMIAMALIGEPKLLIADEPTTALDADVEAEILELLRKIKEERGLTVFFITHDMAHAAAHSDVIYVMKNGAVVERLARTDRGFSPKEDYTKKLFSLAVWDAAPKSYLGA